MRDPWAERLRAIDNLQRLYTVVVGLAITEALKRVVLGPTNQPEFQGPERWLMAVSLLSTVIPFYHGANRYLDLTYVAGDLVAGRFFLIVDFGILFCQGFLFLTLAVNLGQTEQFYWILVVTFVYDALWMLGTQRLVQPRRAAPHLQPGHYLEWGLADCVAALLVIALLVLPLPIGDLARNALLTLICVVRTSFEYRVTWSFYFPPTPAPSSAPNAAAAGPERPADPLAGPRRPRSPG